MTHWHFEAASGPQYAQRSVKDRDKQTLPGTTKYSHREGENWRGKRDEGEDKHRQSHFVEKCWTYLAYFGTMTLSDSICWDPRLQAVLFAAALLEFYGSVLRHFWDVKAPTWADAGSISAKRKALRVSETKRSWEDLGRSGKIWEAEHWEMQTCTPTEYPKLDHGYQSKLDQNFRITASVHWCNDAKWMSPWPPSIT